MSEAKYLVYDTESTGIDVFGDRVVQLFIATADRGGNLLDYWEWVINPGIEVPEGAAEVHGLTTEFLQENGVDPEAALSEALKVFDAHKHLTWVAYNTNYDFSLLYAEFTRHGITSGWAEGVLKTVKFFDPLVVDRAKDKYRPGKRKLINLTEHYGIEVDEDKLHDAAYDVAMTAQVASKVAAKFGIPTNEEQAKMHRAWAASFEQFLRRTNPDAVVERDWPLRLKEH